AAVPQASVRTRTHKPRPGLMCEPTTASPSSVSSVASRPERRSSVGAASSTGASVSVDDKGIPPPALAHVLVLDLLLEQDDGLEQRLGPGRAARHVDVDGDDLVAPL